jgi:acetyl esterase/lipase
MTAPSKITPIESRRGPRRYPVSDGAPLEVMEDGPSLPGLLVALGTRLTMRPALAVLSHVPHLPWPFGLLDFAARALLPSPGTVRATVGLPNASAQLVRAPGVLPADGNRRVVLYLHGGGFLTCGVNSHSRISVALSKFADSPVLVVDYRLIPKHTIGMALDDCHDGYMWLRQRGYQPDQIVLAGDSAGGYLAMALAQRLQAEGETPAALVAISPLLQLEKDADPRIRFGGPSARRPVGRPPAGRSRGADRGPRLAGPDPRLPDGGPADSRGDPVIAPDRRVHPGSHRLTGHRHRRRDREPATMAPCELPGTSANSSETPRWSN